MTQDTPAEHVDPKKDSNFQGQEPFSIDSGGGPKEGAFAGQAPIKDTDLPKGSWEKTKK